jgi:hypothetical protein
MSRALPDWLDAYLEYTDNTEPRRSYRAWAGISAVAAALQRKCYLQLGIETFFPNLYIVLVGPPAARKGTAIRPAKQLLDLIGIQPAADESSRQKLVTALLNMGAIHQDADGSDYIHSSMTIIASELTVFIGYQNIDFLTVLCKWYDCENRFTYDTHNHGKQEVSNVWVNLIGATTPMLIQTSLPPGAIGSGFASRTIFVFEEDKEKVVIEPILSVAQEELGESLRHDLGQINTMCGRFHYSREFIQVYGDWRNKAEKGHFRIDPRLEYYMQRRHVHLLKLCMIYSASTSDDLKVGVREFERARVLLEDAERKMAYTFQGFGANPLAQTQLQVMRVVAEEKQVPFKKLMNMFYEEVSGKDLSVIITTMEQMGFCKLDLMNGIVNYTRKE